ncbi:hypothetical protein EHS13_20265 [Paenibacillus psychroresistens]|uniref:Uncharacterized protein n=1 Tax=Paenibacillus psychroresistens TaxID=1778678 RepID=A0A6B8RMQ8_9BACL|nr:hypothetical protein [Paenibacillus psychroresistens]QGQ97054.1 hypothetical protein EHS13_20265 [Paenibacillus psychroresistens]
MTLKGQVSSVDTINRKARVIFQDFDNVVSADVPYATHLTIEVNDMVAVVFFSNNKSDGLIIAAY